MDAIVLGGNKDNNWVEEGVENKTLLKYGSKTILETIIETLKGLNFERIILTGDSTIPINIKNEVNLFVMGNEIWDKISEVMKVTDSEEFLIVTGDIPLLTEKMVEDALFIYNNQKPDILLFVISKDLVESKYSQFNKSYFILNSRECKIGNLFFINRKSYNKIIKFIIPLIKSRKASLPISYLKIGGLKITIKYLFKTLTIKEVESRIKQITHLNCQVIFFKHPEIAIDIDRKKDLVALREIINLS